MFYIFLNQRTPGGERTTGAIFLSVPAVANASNEHVTQAVVKGIKHLDVFRACYSCTVKVVGTSEVLGDCTRCGVTQKIETCKLRFHARVDLQSEGNLITVTAFTPILENICQTDDVTKAALLTSTPFNAAINNNIVTSLSHVNTVLLKFSLTCCIIMMS